MSKPAPAGTPLIFEADMDAALRRYYRRTGAELAHVDMPFDDMLTAESDELEGEPGDYEIRQRVAGVRSIFAYLLAEGPHPRKLLKRLFAVGRGLNIKPFSEFTMGEAAALCGEGKASHSARCKALSKLIGQHGMRGVRLPGQKTPESSESYAASAKRTCNRRAKPKSRSRSRRRAAASIQPTQP